MECSNSSVKGTVHPKIKKNGHYLPPFPLCIVTNDYDFAYGKENYDDDLKYLCFFDVTYCKMSFFNVTYCRFTIILQIQSYASYPLKCSKTFLCYSSPCARVHVMRINARTYTHTHRLAFWLVFRWHFLALSQLNWSQMGCPTARGTFFPLGLFHREHNGII